jgi:hypothetical protein
METGDRLRGAVGLGTIAMWALIDRNFGTAYRHRGEFLWAVVVLGALGYRKLEESTSVDRFHPT